jgi:hypothetical protein
VRVVVLKIVPMNVKHQTVHNYVLLMDVKITVVVNVLQEIVKLLVLMTQVRVV